MKTHRLKNYLKLGVLLFGIAIILNGCQKDDSISTELNKFPQLKVETLYNPDLTKNRNLYNKLSLFKKKGDLNFGSNIQAREIYIEEYDFNIDDEVVKKITYGDYQSYTFSIFRSEDNGKVENLLLSEQPDGSYKATIISYNLTEQEKTDIKEGIVPENLPDKTTVYSVEARTGGDPIRIDENGNCYFVDQIWVEDGVVYWTEVQRDCPKEAQDHIDTSVSESGSGGGGTGDSSSSGTGDGDNSSGDGTWDPNVLFPGGGGDGTGTGNNTGNPDQTDPDDPNDQEEPTDCLQLNENGDCVGDLTSPLIKPKVEKEDCKKLKEDISDVPLIHTRLHTMMVDSEFAETGLRVDINPSTGVYTPTPVLTDNNGEAHIKIRVNPYTVVIAHTY